MMEKVKVFLTGYDNIGWALDEHAKQIKCILSDKVEFTTLEDCDVIHSVWWNSLSKLSSDNLLGKKVICHTCGHPLRMLSTPKHALIMDKVGLWLSQTLETKNTLESFGIKNITVPFNPDTNIFYPIDKPNQDLEAFKKEWNIPNNKYLIGNFHRDSEGTNLYSPKLVKGPDIFLEVVRNLYEKSLPIHIVLAGPRRHWIIKQLDDLNIPYTYIGEKQNNDDIDINTVDRNILNKLYNIIDLYIVSSRSEGGPHSTLEASAAKCKIVSTRVGYAEDILEEKCIFNNVIEAINAIEKDIKDGYLNGTQKLHYDRILSDFSYKKVKDILEKVYDDLDSIPAYTDIEEKTQNINCFLGKIKQKVKHYVYKRKPLIVGVWHKFVKPPYGGGNQFTIALCKSLSNKKVKIVKNKILFGIDVYLLNSIHFKIKKFQNEKKKRKIKILHRIDGPISLIRGFDKEKDDLVFSINKELAHMTILQSQWSYQNIIKLGYNAVKPVIIHNAVDPGIFNKNNKRPFNKENKIRIVASSWSDNPRKGGPLYKWLEDNLDSNKYEFTFIGRCSEKLTKSKVVPPLSSEKLAEELRQHDIYITASKTDPCSNALIEALSCGLPALVLNDGGHPELVGYGGLTFNGTEDLLDKLNLLAENYEIFQRLITVSNLSDVSSKYLEMLRLICESN